MVNDMGPSFDGFEWDKGNREKCVKHGVSPEEIESIFRSPIVSDVDLRHLIDEKRWYAVGVLANGCLRGFHDPRTERCAFDKSDQRPLHARKGDTAI
jgi:uncharacterized DUF497 family protein